MLETDFLEKFAKFADQSTGLADAKQFAKYLHLPVDHPKAMELFDINDSVYPLKSRSLSYSYSIFQLSYYQCHTYNSSQCKKTEKYLV